MHLPDAKLGLRLLFCAFNQGGKAGFGAGGQILVHHVLGGGEIELFAGKADFRIGFGEIARGFGS